MTYLKINMRPLCTAQNIICYGLAARPSTQMCHGKNKKCEITVSHTPLHHSV